MALSKNLGGRGRPLGLAAGRGESTRTGRGEVAGVALLMALNGAVCTYLQLMP